MADPQLFGRYRVVRRIGSGAFASVWLANDDVLDGAVAVKVLADNWAGRVDVRERFVEEARMLRRADSDRVVRVHDIGDLPDGRPYFVMTYADAGTLADRLSAVPMDAAEALWFAVETARGVAVLHGRGIIHRDLKPSNVLLRSGNAGQEVLVSDLGLAKAALAASGMTLAAGTPGYMPPEQAQGFGLTLASDVYALAALTYRLLAGQLPRQADSPAAVLGRAGDPVRPLARIRADLPDGIDEVLARALAPNPVDRFPDARSFERALVTLAGDLRVRAGVTVGGGSTGGRSPVARSGALGVGETASARRSEPRGAPTVMLRAGSVRSEHVRSEQARAGAVDGPDATAGASRSGPAGSQRPGAGAVGATAGNGWVDPSLRPDSGHPAAVIPERRSDAEVGRRPGGLDRPAGSRLPRRRGSRRAVGVGAAVVGVLVAAGVLAGAIEPGLRDRALAVARGDRFVDSGPLAVTVPAGWAGEYATQAPGLAGLPEPSSALTVSTDPSTLRNPAVGDPGVAVMVWSSDVSAALRTRANRPGCQRQSGPGTVAGISGRITRWTGCPAPGGRWDDFLGTRDGRTLFVQLKASTGPRQADAVLNSVRVR